MDTQAHRPANFLYSPMFPPGPDTTPWRKLPIEGVRTITRGGQDGAAHRPRRVERTGVARLPRRLASAAAGASGAAAEDPGRPRGQLERPVRRVRPAEERQHRRRRRAADVPGHRHGDRVRQEGPARLGRRRRGGGAVAGASIAPTPRRTCAIRRWRRCRCSRRSTPATTCRCSSTSWPPLASTMPTSST